MQITRWSQTGRGPEGGTRPSRGHLRSLSPPRAAAPTSVSSRSQLRGWAGSQDSRRPVSSLRVVVGSRTGVSLGSSKPAARLTPVGTVTYGKVIAVGGLSRLILRVGSWEELWPVAIPVPPFTPGDSFSPEFFQCVRSEASMNPRCCPPSLALPRTGNP